MEVLKQGRNEPIDVAHQVCILYAVTRGYLKDVAVADIRRYEKELYPWLDSHIYEVLTAIRTTGQLSEEHEKLLQQALETYTAAFVGQK